MNQEPFFLDGNEIKAIRKEFGLSQKEFGERLGVTHAHISKIEAGKERASETLLRLINYEFGKKKPVGIPVAELTKPAITEDLKELQEIANSNTFTNGTFFNLEYLLASLLDILEAPIGSESFRELLLEQLACLVSYVSFYLSESEKKCHLSNTMATHLERVKIDIMGSCNELFALLENYKK